MISKKYNNFVKASEEPISSINVFPSISGEDAKRMYLEEVENAENPPGSKIMFVSNSAPVKRVECKGINISDKELFRAAQINDFLKVQLALKSHPEKVNLIDEFGWSLLMIACQGNSVEVVKELLKNNADTSIRDKAGNSARVLVLKNKNVVLAGLLLDTQPKQRRNTKLRNIPDTSQRLKKDYICETCGKSYPGSNKEHLSSTVHNMSASKGKKIVSCYKIPQSNRGYQIMLKNGWDRDSGLGTSGNGMRYPIKVVQKKDKKGLGTDTKKSKPEIDLSIHKKKSEREYHRRNKLMEIDFRRQFY